MITKTSEGTEKMLHSIRCYYPKWKRWNTSLTLKIGVLANLPLGYNQSSVKAFIASKAETKYCKDTYWEQRNHVIPKSSMDGLGFSSPHPDSHTISSQGRKLETEGT